MATRRKPVRFKLGDKVKIMSSMASQFAGKTGPVIEIKPNQRLQTLDKYVVQFENSDQETFWDIELSVVETERIPPDVM
jgi:transcription antitermination factor NusG